MSILIEPQDTQLISEGGFNFPDISLYHKAHLLAHGSYLQVSTSTNIPTWVTLEMA